MISAGFLEEVSPELGSGAVFRAFEQSGRVTGIAGYRHVYLEGMEEASIFVHVAVSDISGKVRACRTPASSEPQSHPSHAARVAGPPGYLAGPVSPPAKWVVGAPRLSARSPSLSSLPSPSASQDPWSSVRL